MSVTRSILILSDLHFGFPSRSTPTTSMLRPLWQGVDHLVLNGDTAELHDQDCLQQAESESRAIVQACEEDDTGLTILAGNHDPFISDLARLSLRQDRVLVTHGHVIHRMEPRALVPGQVFESGDEESMIDRHRMDARRMEAYLQRSRSFEPPEEELVTPHTFLGSIACGFTRPMTIFRILRYWHRFPGWGNQYAERLQPATRVVVLGHSHRQGVRKIGKRLILNTGSYGWPGRPRAVRINGERLTMHRITRNRDVISIDERPIITVDLDQD